MASERRNISGSARGQAIELPPGARLSMALSGAWDIAAATAYGLVWTAPGRLGERDVKWLVGVMLVEFLVIHASPILGGMLLGPGSRARKLKGIAGFGVIYLIFALGMAKSLDGWWPLWVVAALIGEKLLTAALGGLPKRAVATELQFFWGMSALYYLLAVMLTTLLPVPELGVDGAAVRRQAFSSSGLWVSSPECALAAGLLYFGALAVTRFAVAARGRLKPLPQQPTTEANA